tara:strand:+ start:123 stop:2156 length:2034 start_codon:yes stop_codon:yes gene_type:complete
MKTFLLAFFALLLAPIASNAQVSDCVVDLVFEAYFEYVTVGSVDFPEGAVLNWSINGEMMNNGSDVIDLSFGVFSNGPVTVCVAFVSDACPDGVEICETVDLNDIIGGGDCLNPDLIDLNTPCIELWAPVCGCNNVTYGNECEATNYGGVTSWTEGECVGGGVCPDVLLGMQQPTGPCNWIFEIEESGDGAEVNWDFGDGTGETAGYIADHHYAEDGVYIATAIYSDSLCEGVVLSTVISVEGCGEVEDDCTLEMDYDINDYEGYAVFEAYGHPEGVNLIWYINETVFAEGTSTIQVTEDDIEGLEELVVCVMYESEDCPQGVWACEDFSDGEDDCILVIEGYYQVGYGYAGVYGYPEGAALAWYIDGVQVAEGTDVLDLSGLDLPDVFEICCKYVTEDCGSVEECIMLGDGVTGDCPEEIYAIMPKWDMCSWAFEIESNNDFADVSWNFGDGSDALLGSNWMSHTYSNDGIYIVTAEYYSQSCPNGTFINLTIQVEGCGESGDCTLQMEPLYEMNGNIMGWAYDYPEGVNLIWSIDDEFIAEGVSSIDVIANDLPEEFELCVSYQTEECGEVTVCEQYETDAINDFESEASWSVYPVPTSDGVTLEGLSEGVYTCKMVDSQGRLVLERNVSNGTTISLDDITNGIYSLQIVEVNSSVIINSAFKPVYKFKRVVVQR